MGYFYFCFPCFLQFKINFLNMSPFTLFTLFGGSWNYVCGYPFSQALKNLISYIALMYLFWVRASILTTFLLSTVFLCLLMMNGSSLRLLHQHQRVPEKESLSVLILTFFCKIFLGNKTV